MAELQNGRTGSKAGRAQVFAAADRMLKAGRRPTQAGIREALGGGSLQSIHRYLAEWYEALSDRISAAEQPIEGVPDQASSLLRQLWFLAEAGASRGDSASSDGDAAARLALKAQLTALEAVNRELLQARRSVEQSLADVRALLARKDAALEQERAVALELREALSRTTLENAVLDEKLKRGTQRKSKRGPQAAVLRARGRLAQGARRGMSRGSRSRSNVVAKMRSALTVSPRSRGSPRSRR